MDFQGQKYLRFHKTLIYASKINFRFSMTSVWEMNNRVQFLAELTFKGTRTASAILMFRDHLK